MEKQHYQDALASFDQAYSLGRQLKAEDMQNWPAVLEGMGRSAYAIGQYPKAVSAYKELLAYNNQTSVLNSQQLDYFQKQIKDLSAVNTSHDYFHLQGKDITHWNDKAKTITIYVPTGESNPLWKPAFTESLQKAFMEWQTVMQNRVQFAFTDSPKKYDVKIVWANRKDASPVRVPNQTELGYNMTETWGEFMAKSDIYLYLDKGTEAMTDAEFYKTSLHEIGHLLGIHVHSNNIEDVMFPSVHVNPRIGSHLSLRDIATIEKIYQAKPTISNPEGYYLSDFEKFRKKQMRDLECQDAPIITLNFDMPGAYGGQQHHLVCRKKQRPQDQIPVWMPNFNF
jgi:predicted Zn-dependent protease